jgi:hypothetical protein
MACENSMQGGMLLTPTSSQSASAQRAERVGAAQQSPSGLVLTARKVMTDSASHRLLPQL